MLQNGAKGYAIILRAVSLQLCTMSTNKALQLSAAAQHYNHALHDRKRVDEEPVQRAA